jgi:hypothetical protein
VVHAVKYQSSEKYAPPAKHLHPPTSAKRSALLDFGHHHDDCFEYGASK